MRKLIKYGFFILVVTAVWYVTRTTYEYSYYKLEGCENTYLTIILYQQMSDRGLIFVNGKVDYPPTENVLKKSHFSGMDAVFDCIATCKDNIITISCYESLFDSDTTASNMRTRLLDTEEYNKLRRMPGSVDIRKF